MHQDLPLISTITLGFTTAFLLGMVASKIKLSPIVGYLIAGIIIGPYTPGIVANIKIAEELSEVGILLLMFGVGLHFSLKDLIHVKNIAVPGAIGQIIATIFFTLFIFSIWGWPLKSALMVGPALSVASTVVLLRALEEHHFLHSPHANVVIGWLIVEDIIMVLAIVLIPTFSKLGSELSFAQLFFNLLLALSKIVLFILLMVGVGKRFLPRLLTFVADTHSRELFTLAVFAVAMGIAFSAAKIFGVSFALGAFFAGMMIRESELSQEAAAKALPLQDAFAVLFFVSVGMLFNPYILLTQPLQVACIVMIILFIKSIAGSLIILLCHYPLKTALLASAGLAQIGEFSFILANIGVHYQLITSAERDIILAGALISIALNPLLFHINDRIYSFIKHNSFFFLILKRKFLGEDNLSFFKDEESFVAEKRVILVGYGRVGQYISEHLKSSSFKIIVIDYNRQIVELSRKKGLYAIVGDATNELTFKKVSLDRAKALVVAVPNRFEARKIVNTARKISKNVKILVRTDNEEEEKKFIDQKVDLTVIDTREVGRRMVDYLLKN